MCTLFEDVPRFHRDRWSFAAFTVECSNALASHLSHGCLFTCVLCRYSLSGFLCLPQLTWHHRICIFPIPHSNRSFLPTPSAAFSLPNQCWQSHRQTNRHHRLTTRREIKDCSSKVFNETFLVNEQEGKFGLMSTPQEVIWVEFLGYSEILVS